MIATFIWLYCSIEDMSERSGIGASVDLVLPEGIVVLSQSTKRVSIALEGRRAQVDTLVQKRIAARVEIKKEDLDQEDLDQGKAAELEIELKPDMFQTAGGRLPSEVAVTRIDPETIKIGADRFVEQNLKVSPDICWQDSETEQLVRPLWENIEELPKKCVVKHGYEVVDVFVSPGRVTVSGPNSMLHGQETISTLPFDISDLTRTIEAEIGIASRLDGHPVSCGQKVKIYVEVAQVLAQREFKDLEVMFLAPQGFAFYVNTEGKTAPPFTVAGPQYRLKELADSEVIPFLDLRGFTKPAPYELPLKFILPAGIHVIGGPNFSFKLEPLVRKSVPPLEGGKE